MTGKIQAMELFAQIKENNRKLNGCPQHHFTGGAIEALGLKYTCLNCGGITDLKYIGPYIRGFKAAGGNENDVWPNWSK